MSKFRRISLTTTVQQGTNNLIQLSVTEACLDVGINGTLSSIQIQHRGFLTSINSSLLTDILVNLTKTYTLTWFMIYVTWKCQIEIMDKTLSYWFVIYINKNAENLDEGNPIWVLYFLELALCPCFACGLFRNI